MSVNVIGRRIIWLLLIVLLSWNLVRGARIASQGEKENDSSEVAFEKMQLMAQVILHIRQAYVDEEKTSYKDLLYGGLKGMLRSLDAHSQFMEPKNFKDMKDDTAGEFGGLGIVIGMRDGILTVIAPMEDTPAFRAGIQHGDKIVSIDGVSTENISLQEAVKKMRGVPDTKVRLKILRMKPYEFKEIEIVRAVIKVESVKGARIISDNIGYVRIVQFNEPTVDALQKAVEKLVKQGMSALILDLRNNPGGLLKSAIEVSQKFLKSGDKIVLTKGRQGTQYYYAGRGKHYLDPDFHMVILVNGASASASEIVAGALQDHKRAILIGEKTFGKGSVQSVLPMDDGSAIRLTTAKYYTPNERVIHEKGIVPDITVPMSPELWQKVQIKRSREELGDYEDNSLKKLDLENVIDLQLERAIDVLKGIRIFQSQLRQDFRITHKVKKNAA